MTAQKSLDVVNLGKETLVNILVVQNDACLTDQNLDLRVSVDSSSPIISRP